MRVQISVTLEDRMDMVEWGWDAEDRVRAQKITYSGFDVSEMPRNNRHPIGTTQIFDFFQNLGAHGVV